jgi:hypothetical protein
MKLFLIIIFIFFSFFIINLYLKKNNENFVNEESGLVCGQQNDVCSIHASTGKNSCCDGYSCILPNGDYQYKICVNNYRLGNISNIGGITAPNTRIPDIFNFGINELGLSNLKFPKLSFPNFKNMFSFPNGICPAIINNNSNKNITYYDSLELEEEE